MGPRPLLELTDEERAELETQQARTRDARTHRRLAAILKIAAGDPPDLVADALDVHIATVYRWIERYAHQYDSDDLLERPRSGRPRKLQALDDHTLEQLLTASPEQYGYRATAWTVALLRSHIHQHFNLIVSDETLRRRLHQQEYRWKRPRYVYRDADPHKGQKKGASFQH